MATAAIPSTETTHLELSLSRSGHAAVLNDFWKRNIDTTTSQTERDEHNLELRIVLVGKTGAGKSTLGNVFLRKPDIKGEQREAEPKEQGAANDDDKGFAVHRAFSSGTHFCGYQESSFAWGRHMKIVDTPGLFDTSKNLEKTLNELTNVTSLSTPGPHAIIFVIRCDIRFTEEEYQAFKSIIETFGEGVKDFLVLVFTRGETLEDYTIEEMLKHNPPEQLVEVMRIVGDNYAVISKTDDEATRKREMALLLDKIDRVSKFGEKYFSSDEFQMMTEIINEEIKKTMRDDGLRRMEAEYKVKRSMARDREGLLLSKTKMKLKLLETKAFAVLADLEQEISTSKVFLPEESKITEMILTKSSEMKGIVNAKKIREMQMKMSALLKRFERRDDEESNFDTFEDDCKYELYGGRRRRRRKCTIS